MNEWLQTSYNFKEDINIDERWRNILCYGRMSVEPRKRNRKSFWARSLAEMGDNTQKIRQKSFCMNYFWISMYKIILY